jgi:hypothetical protein
VEGYLSDDRAPTIEEIKKLLKCPDRRIKPLVLIMISSGNRIGAFDYLKSKHITPLKDGDGKIIATKKIVYAGASEQYITFISTEIKKLLISLSFVTG